MTIRWRRVLRLVGRGLAGLIVLAVLGFIYQSWWRHPKRTTAGMFVRSAGADVFKFSDIPNTHALSESEVDAYASRLLREMTLDEKIGQMSGDTWLWDLVMVLVERYKYNDQPIPSGLNKRLAIPAVLFSDGPKGVVLNHSTAFPVAMARGASWDRALEGRVADAIGQELRAQGANFYGGVCINLLRHPGWGRAQETYGEDPYLLGEMAAAMIAGIQRHNVMACAKHFALNSVEEPRTLIDVRADERTLREVYLPHFKRAVDAGVAAVMSSYNKVNGDYAAENEWLLRKVLKQEWGFRGFVMSDFFDGVYDGPKAARAGLDIEMPMAVQYGPSFIEAVASGGVSKGLVDEAVQRILRRKIEYTRRPDPRAYDPSLVLAPSHIALTREVAEKSMVLLKNERPLLPLDKQALRTLAVIGRRAEAQNLGDHGSSRVYPPSVVTLLQGLREALGPTRVVFDAGTDLAHVRQTAHAADAVVMVVGLDELDEGEWIPQKPAGDHGGDRRSLALHADEQQMILTAAAENKRIVVVVVGGSAVTMEAWKDRVPAILMAWYPGMEGGHALASILFGDVNPSGKLTVTFPGDVAWLPPFTPGAKSIEYGYYHGYTLAEKKHIEPAFPFGFGLSYTRFSYANLRLSATTIPADGSVDATIDVSNVGARAGEEIVQLYAGFPNALVDRPLKLLRGFEKISLAPGETRAVHFTVKAADLAYYDVTSHAWRVEAREHSLLAGGSSRDADLSSAVLRIEDTGASGH